jgi:hypothetical protein
MNPEENEASPPSSNGPWIVDQDLLKQGIETTYHVIQEDRGFLDFGMSSSDMAIMIDPVTPMDVKKQKFHVFLNAVTWKIASILETRQKEVSLSQDEKDETDKLLIAAIWDELQTHHYHTIQRLLMYKISSTYVLLISDDMQPGNSTGDLDTPKHCPGSEFPMDDQNDDNEGKEQNKKCRDEQQQHPQQHERERHELHSQQNEEEKNGEKQHQQQLERDSIDVTQPELDRDSIHIPDTAPQPSPTDRSESFTPDTHALASLPTDGYKSDLFFLYSSQISEPTDESYFEAQFLTPFLEAHYIGSKGVGSSRPFLQRNLLYILQEKRELRLRSLNNRSNSIRSDTKSQDIVMKPKKKKQKILFHFLYYYPQKSPYSSSVQDLIIDRDDCICPICPLQYTSIQSLLIHCRNQHGNLLCFEDSVDDQGHVRMKL